MDLSHYMCMLCGSRVRLDEEGWGCDCYVIPVHYLETGALDIPKFWLDAEEEEVEESDA